MTLKETITKELLAAVDDPIRVGEVFRRHSGSKGPLYSGLAEATHQLQQRLEDMLDETAETEAHRQHLQEGVTTLEDERHDLEERVQSLEEQRHEAETKLADVQGVLDRADQLARRGFGEEELDRLYDLLGQVAASQGMPPEEGVAQFFRSVDRYEQVLSLELEEKRAEARAATARAEADRWEAEARRKEAESKARASAIDLVEMLLDQGVKADDLPHWSKVLQQAGVTAEQLADSLDQFGSIETLAYTRQARADELQVEVSTLESQLQALTEERGHIQVAIRAVKDEGLKQVKRAGSQVTELVESLVLEATDIGRLRAEAAGLGEWVEAARLLRSGNPDSWKQLPPEIIQHFLIVALRWFQVEGRDPQVLPPLSVTKANSLLRYMPLRPSQALLWALAGVFTEDQRKSLVSAR